MSALTVYGIPNCDTVKKARRWLDEQDIAYTFHNFKKDGVPAEALGQWVESFGLDKVVNRRGTTWRKLSDAEKELVEAGDAQSLAFVAEQSSLIKRPIVADNSAPLLIGFDAVQWAEQLKA